MRLAYRGAQPPVLASSLTADDLRNRKHGIRLCARIQIPFGQRYLTVNDEFTIGGGGRGSRRKRRDLSSLASQLQGIKP